MCPVLSYSQLAYHILDKIKIPLTPKEIWEESLKDGSANQLPTKGEKPWNSIKYAIQRDINDDTRTHFCIIENDPNKYSLKKFVFSSEERENEELPEKKVIHESDLHAILCAFVKENNHFQCDIKTIDEKRGRNKRSGLNEWAHPDMVGVAVQKNLHNTTTKLQKELSEYSFRLFSFELKLSLSIGNLRSSYFQAVSNSSWANEGYLVTLNIEENDSEFQNEMTLLNNAFGIGIIQLDIKEIFNSKIIFPAKYRENLDWLIINKLVENNRDFREFIDDVTSIIKNEIGEKRFDEVQDVDELEKRFRQFFKI